MIIPGILEIDFEEIKDKVNLIDKEAKVIQIDVADGVLVNNKTFQNVEKLDDIDTKATFELHLMVESPHEFMEKKIEKVSKAIAHIEARNIHEFIAQAMEHKYKIGLCINPETPTRELRPFLSNIDYVQFMGIVPGAQGRSFKPEVLEKIVEFRDSNPDVHTQIDGGVGKNQLAKVLKAGVDDIVIGSTIFTAESPVEMLKELQRQVEEHA